MNKLICALIIIGISFILGGIFFVIMINASKIFDCIESVTNRNKNFKD